MAFSTVMEENVPDIMSPGLFRPNDTFKLNFNEERQEEVPESIRRS